MERKNSQKQEKTTTEPSICKELIPLSSLIYAKILFVIYSFITVKVQPAI
jgi:hypothetical protein